MIKENQKLRICHVAMGDLWAGAEVQLVVLIEVLLRFQELDLTVVLFNEGRLAIELQKLRVPVYIFPETAQSSLKILQQLTDYCRERKFDLLHTHKYKDNILGAMAAARSGVPYVVRTVHGLSEPFKGLPSIRMRFYEFCDDVVIRTKVNRLIAVSSQIGHLLSQKFGSASVVKIHNGIPIEHVQQAKPYEEVRKHLDVDKVEIIIGTVGRLTPVKAHEHFLTAAKQLLQSHKNLCFVIVGSGPRRRFLEEIARKSDISSKVRFLGHRDDTRDLIRAMDIFVLPSLHEGIPMVLLEAMALARPIVASAVGGIPEVLTNQVHGLLVPPAKPDEIVGACEAFLSDPLFMEKCGQAALTRVKQEFSSELMGAKVVTLYRQLFQE
ncbi:glycosyltransferase family 4 protein [Nitrospira sp. KM1]|uniref:glycosyltransferase family 4 protein n=1 Tax=Nitrospira sp. KM1 TaxID=1936990 RepID=UPI00156561B3|nr:glycosyltransferase family 4 protein [Nitrospira sp. KM1]